MLAAAILFVKAGLGLWAALVVLSASPTRPQSFLGYPVSRRGVLVGLVLVALVAVTLVVAVSLLRARPGARWAGLLIEAAAIGLALSRVSSRPGTAYFSLALSGAVVLLLAIPARPRPRRVDGQPGGRPPTWPEEPAEY